MPVLDQWRRFIQAPQTLAFRNMQLIAGDGDPPIVQGHGEIRFVTQAHFEYTLTGRPADIPALLRRLKEQRSNPYDPLLRFRLEAGDEQGIAYMGGWTLPDVQPGRTAGEDFTFRGECEGLTFDVQADPSEAGSTEVQYAIPPGYPASILLSRFVSTHRSDGTRELRYDLEALGSRISFHFDDAERILTVSAPASDALPLTYSENWFGEPLRVMFGQPIYPRLVARIFPNGRAMVWVRVSPTWMRSAHWAALWHGEGAIADKDGFWRLYASLLRVVAAARDFESHKITQLYEEIMQASRGSRWVWALTFASSIEGLIRILSPRGSRRSDANMHGIDAMQKHIESWPGQDGQLKQVAINAVRRTAEVTPKHVLKGLVANGVITARQLAAWEDVRNAVMHGSLVSPYSSEHDDDQLLALAELMHALTHRAICQLASGSQA